MKTTDAAEQLMAMQCALEAAILTHIQEFERTSGMCVHSVMVARIANIKGGRRETHAIEVAAMLR